MGILIKGIGKELYYPIAAVLPRWQADIVNDYQADAGPIGACIVVRG
jgi:hypothetical protein